MIGGVIGTKALVVPPSSAISFGNDHIERKLEFQMRYFIGPCGWTWKWVGLCSQSTSSTHFVPPTHRDILEKPCVL